MAIPADYVKSQAFLFIVLPTCNPETEMLRVKMSLNIADTCSTIKEVLVEEVPLADCLPFSPPKLSIKRYGCFYTQNNTIANNP